MNDEPPVVDTSTFRRLLGSFATGVTVLTLADHERPMGMTASAVASVSMDPPLLLVCIGHDATLHDAFRDAARFALNVLAVEQRHLSQQFADDFEQRFDGVEYTTDPTGIPLLAGAVAHIICERHQLHAAGDHSIVIGRITAGEAFDREPLLHFRGSYRAPDPT